MADRWAVRCTDCLEVGFIEESPYRTRMECASCGGSIEVMGQVGGSSLYKVEVRSVCDGRCTGARGPICDCHCGGVNHGTGRVVVVRRDLGPIPKVSLPDPEASRARAAEWHAALAALDAAVEPLTMARRRGEWLPYERFRLWLDARGIRRKAGEMKTHASRMKKVREMVARLSEPVLARAS